MTGFLKNDLLRAQEAPDFVVRALLRGWIPRPRLIAQWSMAPDGRLVCRWQTDDKTEDESSG